MPTSEREKGDGFVFFSRLLLCSGKRVCGPFCNKHFGQNNVNGYDSNLDRIDY